MKLTFKAYPKIKQYKDIVRNVKQIADYKGKDENGDPIYEQTIKPKLVFTGLVKLHGTNAGICFTPEFGLQAQKRSQLIPVDQLTGHFGFNQFVQVTKKEVLTELLQTIFEDNNCSEDEQITLFGEWAGKGIQKNVGISEIEKAFYIFDCMVFNTVTEEERWLDINLITEYPEGVYNLSTFKKEELTIDFNKPALVQGALGTLTLNVEKECPVSKKLGVLDGIGEGLVWTTFWKDQRFVFKVKGAKHSVTKTKQLVPIDPIVVANIYDFVDYACTVNRVEQGIQEVNATEKKDTPSLLKWVANDIIKEEDATLAENNLEWKQVAGEISNRVRQIFFDKIDKV